LPKGFVNLDERVSRTAVNVATQRDTRQAEEELSLAAGELNSAKKWLVYSSTSFGRFLAELHERNPRMASGAYEHYARASHPRAPEWSKDPFRDRPYFDGMIASSLFFNPELISANADSYKSSMADANSEALRLRDDFQQYFRTTKEEVGNWKVDVGKEEKERAQKHVKGFEDAQGARLKEFETFRNEANEKISSLEKTYQAQLRLQGPGEYWEQLESKYSKSGYIWSSVAAVSVALVLRMVSNLLYWPPDTWKDSGISLVGVKGAIVLTVGLSLAAYLINLFVRLAVSSFHLARDARERYQLTHVYLALMKENAVEEKDRAIILTALFSRADTGLLRHDGSPSMPTPMSALFDSIKRSGHGS
ncbi:MAG: DUF6161 domain-containing protein, partial [Acidobacteriota bacterium]